MKINEDGKNQEVQYRVYMESANKDDPSTGKIDIEDVFIAVANYPEIQQTVDEILKKNQPLTLVIEGSASPNNNIDTSHKILSPRNNGEDQIILFDISEKSVLEHSRYIQNTYPMAKYRVMQSDMMNVALADCSADLVVNDCTINYSSNHEQNVQTLDEVKRILKDENSVCILSVVVDHRYDNERYGQDQENVPPELIDQPGEFSVLPQKDSEKRKCWSVPYYERLFEKVGFSFIKFDVEEGRKRFANPPAFSISYRRYLLKKRK